jgi:hypothetical protein
MTMTEIFRWANQNQGVLSLFAVLLYFPTLLILVYRGVRKVWPSRQERRLKIQEEFAHAERLKKEIESRVRWDKVLGNYGEFLIRDAERRLAETEEIHSRVAAPYSIAVLTDIHTEHLEFILGAMGIQFIKNIAGVWHFADEKDDEAIKVDTVCWLNYRDIVLIRWETDEYWEWPQICCRFTSANRFPFSRVFFAQQKTGVNRPFYREVCLVSDVFPKSLLSS